MATASRPLKINMEPKDYSLEKENHLPSTSILGFHIHFPGCVILMEIPKPTMVVYFKIPIMDSDRLPWRVAMKICFGY